MNKILFTVKVKPAKQRAHFAPPTKVDKSKTKYSRKQKFRKISEIN